ncbi:MAG: radical SAM protein, partial [Rickettsiales bacterium]|nr:radical SAM protein [Rickettsiales bacterium]
MKNMNKPHNLYIHIPFCASKCNYCAFYSAACATPDWDGFCDGILTEIDHWYDILGKITVPTIFFGGGTPSLMPPHIFAKIMWYIKNRFLVPDDAEVSVESNPGTIDKDKLKEFQSNGMNRLSIGIQSLNNQELKFLGRRHDAATATKLIKSAKDLGLHVSGDFMYGLPGQTVEDVRTLCQSINELDMEHCSMYELSLEPGTPFSKMNLKMPDNETM